MFLEYRQKRKESQQQAQGKTMFSDGHR